MVWYVAENGMGAKARPGLYTEPLGVQLYPNHLTSGIARICKIMCLLTCRGLSPLGPITSSLAGFLENCTRFTLRACGCTPSANPPSVIV